MDQVCNLIVDGVAAKQGEVDAWLDAEFSKVSLPLHLSLDVRYAGFKVTPVDTNLFPAGFNNLSSRDFDAVVSRHKDYFDQVLGGVSRVILVPEDNITNKFYLEHLYCLSEVIRKSGVSLMIASPNIPESREPAKLETLAKHEIEVYSLRRDGKSLVCNDMVPEIILLNNDLTVGIPEIMKDIDQPIVPSPELGWHKRRKKESLVIFNQVAEEFCKLIDIDPWRMVTEVEEVKEVDFLDRKGLDQIADVAADMLSDLERKYKDWGVDDDPFVMVKNSAGTYGRGVLSVKSCREILELNRKERVKMQRGKEGVEVSSVIIQEGVPTRCLSDGDIAEPVVYSVGGEPIGAFFRVHAQLGPQDNLNAKGMKFVPIDVSHAEPSKENRCIYYLSKLTAIAVGREIKGMESS